MVQTWWFLNSPQEASWTISRAKLERDIICLKTISCRPVWFSLPSLQACCHQQLSWRVEWCQHPTRKSKMSLFVLRNCKCSCWNCFTHVLEKCFSSSRLTRCDVMWCDMIWYCRARGALMDSNGDIELWEQPALEQHQGRSGLQWIQVQSMKYNGSNAYHICHFKDWRKEWKYWWEVNVM